MLEPAGLVRRHARALERRLAEEVGERAALEHQLAETEHRLGEEVGQRIALERRLAEQERALADLTATLQRLQAQREGPD